tara:strand:- start:27145 stop:28026 length:882 start_codon:yes stop_codon:yes gene_type:complete
MMYVILGKTGYIGEAFCKALEKQGKPHIALSRDFKYNGIDVDYSSMTGEFDWCLEQLANPSLYEDLTVINCAGYIGKPNVDACESNKADTIAGNVCLPQYLSQVCWRHGANLAHISSGCIYSGSEDFTEEDAPNFAFNSGGSFYSGTKALAEGIVSRNKRAWQFRLRIPFDEIPSPRNYLTKCLSYDNLIDVENSVSHRGDFVNACINLMEQKAPYGIYNVCNPGGITTKQVAGMLAEKFPDEDFNFFEDYKAFENATVAPRSNCTLSSDKLLNYTTMRSAEDALLDAINKYE